MVFHINLQPVLAHGNFEAVLRSFSCAAAHAREWALPHAHACMAMIAWLRREELVTSDATVTTNNKPLSQPSWGSTPTLYCPRKGFSARRRDAADRQPLISSSCYLRVVPSECIGLGNQTLGLSGQGQIANRAVCLGPCYPCINRPAGRCSTVHAEPHDARASRSTARHGAAPWPCARMRWSKAAPLAQRLATPRTPRHRPECPRATG